MLQNCCAELRKLTQSLLHCTGQRNLLKELSVAFVSLARSQEKAISKARNTPKADVLLSQALQDCQTAGDLLQGYEKRGGEDLRMASAGLEYTRGMLYQAAGRNEDALPCFEAACAQLGATLSPDEAENTLLKLCEKAVKETRKMLKH